LNVDGEDSRFHGRRWGRRLNPGRRRALAEALPPREIHLAQGCMCDPYALFARPLSKVWLEIGFGNGEHLIAQAERHPEIGFLGAEPFLNGVSALAKALADDHPELDNIRIWPEDARPLMAALPDASLGRVFVLFPDPWPKRRHHDRRFIGPANLDRLARIMADGAELRLATDHDGLARWMLYYARRHPAFAWTARRAADWRQRPADGAPTRYEQKQLKGTPTYLSFRRRPRASGQAS